MIGKDVQVAVAAVVGLRRMRGYLSTKTDGRSAAAVGMPRRQNGHLYNGTSGGRNTGATANTSPTTICSACRTVIGDSLVGNGGPHPSPGPQSRFSLRATHFGLNSAHPRNERNASCYKNCTCDAQLETNGLVNNFSAQ